MNHRIAIAVAALAVTFSATPSHAAVYPVEDASHRVNHLRVVNVEFEYRNALLYVEFNDGSAAKYTPCWWRGQKGNCYWVPAARVNTYGHSWVVVHGERVPIRERVLVQAGLAPGSS